MLSKLRILLGVMLLSILFGGVLGRYLEDDSHRFPDPFQMGPVAKFQALSKIMNALEREKEQNELERTALEYLKENNPDYDNLQQKEPVYPDQPDELFENLPKPVPPPRNPHKDEIRKKNVRKACKFFY